MLDEEKVKDILKTTRAILQNCLRDLGKVVMNNSDLTTSEAQEEIAKEKRLIHCYVAELQLLYRILEMDYPREGFY